MSHECRYGKVIELIQTDIKEIKKDIRELLTFKWKIYGVIITVSILTSLLFKGISMGIL